MWFFLSPPFLSPFLTFSPFSPNTPFPFCFQQGKRQALKETFISKKQLAKDLIKLLKNGPKEGLGILKEKELNGLVEEFRAVDADFRALGVMAERDALMEGGSGGRGGRQGDQFDPTRAKNDDLLNKAAGIQSDNLAKLKGGLQSIEETKEVGKLTAAKLEEDREKLKRIDQGLDDVQVSCVKERKKGIQRKTMCLCVCGIKALCVWVE